MNALATAKPIRPTMIPPTNNQSLALPALASSAETVARFLSKSIFL